MRALFNPFIVVAIVGVLVGALLQSQLSRNGDRSAPEATQSTEFTDSDRSVMAGDGERVATLAMQLAQEIAAREALQANVEELTERVAALTGERPAAAMDSGDTGPVASKAAPEDAWFNEQALIDAGIDEVEANRIRVLYEELALERLYVRDQAQREGWDGNQRREAFQVLREREQALRSELGEDSYDAYLYASGQPNRVRVQSVLAGSAADVVGLQSGDYILSYADERVYNGRELRSATASGTIDDMVTVTILRDESVQEVYVPRGPLGIRMDSPSVAPGK